MSYRKNIKHVGRNTAQKRDYIESVFASDTVNPTIVEDRNEAQIDTVPFQKTGEPEKITDLKNKGTKPNKTSDSYRSPKTIIGYLIGKHLLKIIGTIITIIITIVGFLYTQQYGNNRELGEIKTRLDNAEKSITTLQADSKDFGNRQSTFEKTISLIQKDIEYIQKIINK